MDVVLSDDMFSVPPEDNGTIETGKCAIANQLESIATDIDLVVGFDADIYGVHPVQKLLEQLSEIATKLRE